MEPVIAKVHESSPRRWWPRIRTRARGDRRFAVRRREPGALAGRRAGSALRGANARFYRRFEYIEQRAAAQGRDLDEMTLADMDALWDDAKANGL